MKTFSCENSPNQSIYGGINRFNHLRSNSLRIPPPVAPSDNSSLKSSSSHHHVQNNSDCCLPTENSSQFNSRPERMVNSFSMPYEPNKYFHMNVSRSNSDAQSCFLKSHNSMPIYTNHASILLNNGNRNYNCLEEQNGIEVGRTSPSGSSSDSRKSRYSTASLDSGRGSDGKTGQFKRISVHSCDSIGSSSSHKDISTRNSSSSSSLGSGVSSVVETDSSNLSTPTTNSSGNWSGTNGLTIAEMVLHGVTDNEIIQTWLSSIHFEEYAPNFIHSGYDMPTIYRMTPEDLTAIGITKPAHRRILKTEIQRLNIADGIPNFRPNTLLEWLTLLHLEEYFNILCQQGYDTIDRVTELAWEDLEEVGIKKLGHQKKMMLAIKKIKNFNSYNAEVIYSPLRKLPIEKPSHFSNPNSCPNMMMIRQAANNFQLPINPHCQTANNFQLPINSHCQEVPIKTNPHKAATPESPTANLKTFQQNIIQTNGFMLQRQSSEGIDMNYYVYDDSNNYYQNVRGRSLESLNYSNTENGFRQFNENQRNSFNPNFLNNQLKYQNHCKNNQGYETDSEIINNKLEKSYYEYDATATLNRPKNFIKNKPIAKIAAKTRDSRARITLSQQVQDLSPTDKSKVQFHCVENPINYSNDNISQSDNYANFKRKTPPPPPKRTNSIKSNTRCLNSDKSSNQFMMQHQNGLDEMQDQAFATCVKSLASRFSMMATRKSPPPIPIHYRQTNNNEIHQTNNNETHQTNNYEINQFNNDDFPPPPSPLLCKSEHSSAKDQFNVSKMDTSDREANISSSSSTESMPFANDNMGTIKFKEPSSAIHHNSVNNSPLKDFSKNNYIHSFKKEVISPKQKKLNGFDGKEKMNGPTQSAINEQLDPLDDIETMLVNLSNQLDMMLVNDKN